jgi:hypothetical protein
VSDAAIERAAVGRATIVYRDPSGGVVRVRPRESIRLEEGTTAKRRTRRDKLAHDLRAVQFTRAESGDLERVDSYDLMRPLGLAAASERLYTIAAGGGLANLDRAHLVARLLDADGHVIYRAMSHGVKGDGALGEGSASLAAWAKRYKSSKLLGIDVIRLGERGKERERRKTEGARLRARERRDRKRGIRTTRGR